MCGIVGFYGITAPRVEADALLGRMVTTLAHRGPDGAAQWLDASGTVGLGHTRLAIIDLVGGVQPMVSEDAGHAVVFNGELYNYRELRVELERRGHRFRTRSDTEVLLHAFREWGRACLPRLQGMFAFAAFNQAERTLLLARDRTGIKPLYFQRGPAGLYFGSELKAILAVPQLERRVDLRALSDFLVLSYPVGPRTFFAGINELDPGTWLEVRGDRVETGRYWRWEPAEEPWDVRDALGSLETSLVEALRSHLLADVPIGAFLSGGIDSSLLVALIVTHLQSDLQTFTVRFAEAGYDESPFARAVAERFATRHHEIYIENNRPDLERVGAIFDQFDQPFGDSSAIPTYLISREIRKHVKVVISGDGGDEMFGGYARFFHADLARSIGHLPQPVLATISRGLQVAAQPWPETTRPLRRLLSAATARGPARLTLLSSYISPDGLGAALRPEIAARLDGYRPSVAPPGPAVLPPDDDPGGRDFIASTIHCALPFDYLRKVDVMSGAHGVEVRVPFLADQVLRCAATLPRRLLYRGRQNKILLRELARRYLPREVVTKPKGGFGIPLDTWLGVGGRAEVARALAAPGARIHDYVNPDHAARLAHAFARRQWRGLGLSRFQLYQQAYALWSFERWLARWTPVS